MNEAMEMFFEWFPHMRVFIVVAVIAFAMVGVSNIVDCCDAIYTARVAGISVQSAKLRHAMWKLAKYWAVMFAVLTLDTLMALCGMKLPFVTVGIAVCMILIEVVSMFEHARLRKDKIAKLPGSLKELVDFFGEDELKELASEWLRRKLIKE